MDGSARNENQANEQFRSHAGKPDLGLYFPDEQSSAGGLRFRERVRTCSATEAEEVEKGKQENSSV